MDEETNGMMEDRIDEYVWKDGQMSQCRWVGGGWVDRWKNGR